MKKILIADQEHNVTFTLTKVLQAKSYEVRSCNDYDGLVQLTGSQNFDLILINSRMTMADGSDPILSLQITQPSAPFMVIYDRDAPERKSIPRVFDQIRKPIDFRHAINRIKELYNGGGFSGIISGINLADYIQMLCMNKITKAILIRKNKQQGIILVQEGKIVYTDTAELKGEEAFHEIMSWKEGQIKAIKVKKFPTPNINRDIQQLLLTSSMFINEEDEATTAGKDKELFASEIIASLHDEAKQDEELAEIEIPKVSQQKEMPEKRFFKKHFGRSVAILTFLLVGLFITARIFF
jgi:response regulator RpfG family c-di-GMP phosphodiesterase